jgi:hypothetical protein
LQTTEETLKKTLHPNDQKHEDVVMKRIKERNPNANRHNKMGAAISGGSHALNYCFML